MDKHFLGRGRGHLVTGSKDLGYCHVSLNSYFCLLHSGLDQNNFGDLDSEGKVGAGRAGPVGRGCILWKERSGPCSSPLVSVQGVSHWILSLSPPFQEPLECRVCRCLKEWFLARKAKVLVLRRVVKTG